ncbi:MAG: hypothetical protein H6868_02355 [Rhodospirillales bacterium]|nr:hypothetical protein [Rhodospirillales bacterium]
MIKARYSMLCGLGFLLTACAASVTEYHSVCMETYETIAQQVACVKANVAQTPDMQRDTLIHEYLKTGDLLVQQVRNGETSEADAQLRFIEKLNEIRRKGLQEEAYRAQIFEAYDRRFPVQTTCVPVGNEMHCTSY